MSECSHWPLQSFPVGGGACAVSCISTDLTFLCLCTYKIWRLTKLAGMRVYLNTDVRFWVCHLFKSLTGGSTRCSKLVISGDWKKMICFQCFPKIAPSTLERSCKGKQQQQQQRRREEGGLSVSKMAWRGSDLFLGALLTGWLRVGLAPSQHCTPPVRLAWLGLT